MKTTKPPPTFTLQDCANALMQSDDAPVWRHGSAISVVTYLLRRCIGLHCLASVRGVQIDLGNGYIMKCSVNRFTPGEAPR